MHVYNIKNIRLVLFFLCMVIGIAAIASVTRDRESVPAGSVNSGGTKDPYTILAVSLLREEITNAVNERYDGQRSCDLANAGVVVTETAGTGEIEVTVEVNSYSGEHEAPFSLEILVFRITDGAVSLKSHKSVSLLS